MEGIDKLPKSFRKFLVKHGDEMLDSFVVYRVPLDRLTTAMLHLITAGQWNKIKERGGQDKLYHVFAIINGKYTYEKTAVPVLKEGTAAAEGNEHSSAPVKRMSIREFVVNAMLAGLMIAGFCFMQRGKSIWAALLLVIAVYIKLYGAAAFALFLFFPGKIRFLLYSALWTVILFLLPLFVIPFHTVTWQYQNWTHTIAADQAVSYGISIFGWLYSWFGMNNKGIVQGLGVLLFFVPFLRVSMYKNEAYRLLTLAAILIWVIVFNHKAESATFIIAVAGVGIWYYTEKPKLWRSVLLWFIFIFTCLSYTDVCPSDIKNNFIRPYAIKAVPCVMLWCIIVAELVMMKGEQKIPALRAEEQA